MARARIAPAVGDSALADWFSAHEDGVAASRSATATAVRYTLQLLADKVPGNSVEVRVPPFGAVQCVEGPGHTRGTPPNVIEMNPDLWLQLATGILSWPDAAATGKLSASGTRADVSWALPVARPR